MFPLFAYRVEVSVSKQKREAIAALLRAHPQRSDPAIAKQAKVSHHTVAKVRAEIEANGEFPHKDDGRIEASGHKARGQKPKPLAAVRDARGRFISTPGKPEALAEEVDRQPPDHADDGGPTSKPAGTDEGAEAVAAELFDDFLVFALAESDLWDVIAPALPEELFDRIDRHIEALLAVPGEQRR